MANLKLQGMASAFWPRSVGPAVGVPIAVLAALVCGMVITWAGRRRNIRGGLRLSWTGKATWISLALFVGIALLYASQLDTPRHSIFLWLAMFTVPLGLVFLLNAIVDSWISGATDRAWDGKSVASLVQLLGDIAGDPHLSKPKRFGIVSGVILAALQYNRARYYSPTWGRFVSEDPIGVAGGINLFGYVGQAPTMFPDPLGLEPRTKSDMLSMNDSGYCTSSIWPWNSQPCYSWGELYDVSLQWIGRSLTWLTTTGKTAFRRVQYLAPFARQAACLEIRFFC